MKADAAVDRARGAARILVVDDEARMRRVLSDNLEFEGYRVASVATAEEALAALEAGPIDLVVLDVMLPGMSGFELCRLLRARGVTVPIIMLTARGDETDRVVGLDLGADDYVCKPFGVRELLARIRAQLRRRDPAGAALAEFAFGDVRVDLVHRLVTRRGRRVELSQREFELLRYFILRRGEVVTRDQLLRDVWGYHQSTITRTVDNFIAKLRTHLEPDPHDPRYIVTIHGVGYQFVA